MVVVSVSGDRLGGIESKYQEGLSRANGFYRPIVPAFSLYDQAITERGGRGKCRVIIGGSWVAYR
jgi:hypothetical protein